MKFDKFLLKIERLELDNVFTDKKYKYYSIFDLKNNAMYQWGKDV